MKKFLILFLFPFLTYGFVPSSDDVVGEWFSEDRDGKIEIFKRDNHFYGKLVWVSDNKKENLDDKNPDQNLRKRKVLGIELPADFSWNEQEMGWRNGTIYDPKKGKTYSCKMNLEGPDKLYIRGFVGIPLFGRTTYWTKAKNEEMNLNSSSKVL